MAISVPSNASTVDRIRQIHSSAVANELVEFKASSRKLGFEASGWTSNANYHVKRTTILLFINHRAVESSAIRTAIQRTYSTFLPKGGHPFVYLSLSIDPARVDVNVHPTKREVNFLNEDEIVESITDEIRTQLSKVDTSRTFMTQSLLPTSTKTAVGPTSTSSNKTTPTLNRTQPRPTDNMLIRTDPSIRKITSMLPPSTTQPNGSTSEITYTHNPRPSTTIRLTTIKTLRASVRDAMHSTLTSTLAAHTYIGVVDTNRRLAAIQSGPKLLLVDYGMLANEFFYQVGLTDFANFGTIAFDPPLDLRALIQIAVDVEKAAAPANIADEPPTDWAKIAPAVNKQLIEQREMLAEYFNLLISKEGMLESIPLLLKGYMPSLAKLPRFLMRLGPCVDWTDEMECFRSFLIELASFYAPEQLPSAPVTEQKASEGKQNESEDGEGSMRAEADPTDVKRRNKADEDPSITARREQLTRMLEFVLFPAIRARIVATKGMLGGVLEVADLKGLYRVFERC